MKPQSRLKTQHWCNRLLQALRAGPLSEAQIQARIGLRSKPLGYLADKGFVERRVDGEPPALYAITEAGLAACPPRNPAAASRAVHRQPPARTAYLRQGRVHLGLNDLN